MTDDITPMVGPTIMQKVDAEIARYMRDPDAKPLLTIMRLIKVDLEEIRRSKPHHNEPNEDDYYTVLARQLKKLNDERTAFADAGRDTTILDAQIAFVKAKQPAMLSEDEIRGLIKEYKLDYAEMPTKLNIGGIMQALNLRYANRFDKGVAARIAKEVLNG